MRFLCSCAVWFAALAFFAAAPALAQTPPPWLAGTYNASEPDVAAHLRLQPDGRFEYALRYGTIDETSQGSWTAENGTVVLTSDPVTPPAFDLVGTQTGTGGTLEVSLDTPAQWPAQLFSVFLQEPDGTVSQVPFAEGPLNIPMTRGNLPTKIAVVFPVYQLASRPYPIPPGARAMHFRFVPNDLGKVAFDHLRLTRAGDAFVLNRFDRFLRFRKQASAAAPAADEPPDGTGAPPAR